MAVMTHAQMPPTTRRAHHIDPRNLTPDTRDQVENTLWELGIESGHTANDGGIRDAAHRLLLSAHTAATIGLPLPDGEEIAQCAVCNVIAPSSLVREDDRGTWRCTIADPDGTTCYSNHQHGM